MSLDKNCTKICINFQLKFIKNIYFWKNKRKTLSYFYSLGHFGPASTRAAQQRAATARPTACSAARARSLSAPRPQPGPGPGIQPRALSRLGCGAGPVARGRPSRSSGGAHSSGHQKPGRPRPSPENPRPFLFLLSSPTATVAKTKGARGHLVTGEEVRTTPVPSPSPMRVLAHGRARCNTPVLCLQLGIANHAYHASSSILVIHT